MTSIIFQNKGTIDPKSITTFGVSSKESPSAIGFFGTGLKYAIAILLREGCEITIYSGDKSYQFATRREKVRVDEFKFVTMNGRRIGFTTELGKTWELWQAFRELYCNTKDEGGTVNEAIGAVVPMADTTVIKVKGQPFMDVWTRRNEYILNTQPIMTHEGIHVHPGSNQYVYYRGMRAYRLCYPSQFTYNIQRKVDLSEDRSIKYQWDIDQAVRTGWCESTDDSLIQRAVTAPKGTHEHELNFGGVLPSPQFLSTVERLARTFDPYLNKSAMEVCRIWLMDQLHAAKDAFLSPVEELRLAKAKDFCHRIGYNVSDYPVVVSEFLGADVLGRAHNETIYISKRALLMGTKMVAGTLIEEFLHLRHKLADCERPMQNFLLDALCTMGEQLIGEPL
jgi:hypothetical protein